MLRLRKYGKYLQFNKKASSIDLFMLTKQLLVITVKKLSLIRVQNVIYTGVFKYMLPVFMSDGERRVERV